MSDDDTNKSRKRGRPAKCQNIQKQFRNKLIDRCKSTNKKTIDESKKKKGRPPFSCEKVTSIYNEKMKTACFKNKKYVLAASISPKMGVPLPSGNKKK